MRTTTRIIIVLFLCFLGVVALFGGSVYFFLNKYSFNDLYKRLETRARIAAARHFDPDHEQAESLYRAKEQYLERLPGEREHLLDVEPLEVLEKRARAAGLPRGLATEMVQNGHAQAKHDNVFYVGVRHRTGTLDKLVVVSADNYYATHHQRYLRGLLGALMVFTIVLTTGFFLYFRRHIFDPIARVTDEVKQISTENMHLRLAEDRNNTEINALIATFNGLLDRMETAFETQKNFIGNASHEFGTPLTAIIGEAEVVLAKERTPEAYRESIRTMLTQAERLDKITRSLLFLARTGYTNNRIDLSIVRMDAVVWAVKEMMDDLHPGNNISLDLSLLPEDPRKLKVNGNADLLHLALANVVNNAFKYSSNKPVCISVAAGDGEVIILVKDQGIGIPEDEIQFIYDPFFRASNTTYYEGYGIGMPLTRNVVKLHRGRIAVTSRAGAGTTVRITLPTIG